MSEAEADPPQPSVWKRRWSAFVRHPLSLMVWFVLFSLAIKEHYPFSHYPMYSGWGERTHYFYLKNEEGPIEAKSVFRVSVPRIKKLYGGIIDDIEDERGVGFSELTDADFAEAGRLLLKQLREEAPPRRREKWGEVMDSDLTLVRVEIAREGREFKKEERDVVTTSADNQIVKRGGAGS